MITGKDKEKVRQLEIKNERSTNLIQRLMFDVDNLLTDLQKQSIDVSKYWRLHDSLGRCEEFMNET